MLLVDQLQEIVRPVASIMPYYYMDAADINGALDHGVANCAARVYAYGLNAMSDGHNIVLSDRAAGLIEQYKKRGMQVYPVPISEFQKSGGGVKCLTLELRD